MTRTTRRVLLGTAAFLSGVLLLLFLTNLDLIRDEVRPADIRPLGTWLASHPADWRAASALSSVALDSSSPRRFDLWRAAYEHARYLAPRKTTATTSFVRGGLFHWYELPQPDRAAVLSAAAPLLRNPQTFTSMYRPLWELTHDFGYLRRNAPDSERALIRLRDIAVMHGLFAEYRELRDAIDRKRLETFETNRLRLSPPELIALLPPRLMRSDERLVRELLEQLHQRPLDASNAPAARGRADELVRFAIRHGIGPLDGVDALIDTPAVNPATRARLALALGRADAAGNIELTSAVPGAPEWVPYYLERSAFEARNGDATMAALYRRRADIGGDEGKATVWTGTCGKNEVCGTAVGRIAAARAGEPIAINVQNAQSDEIPPYVEIYVGDTLMAEGAVVDAQRFRVAAPQAGVNRIEVRLANPWTRNRIQRRVRLS